MTAITVATLAAAILLASCRRAEGSAVPVRVRRGRRA